MADQPFADVLPGRPAPALSATSDAPTLDLTNALPNDEPAPKVEPVDETVKPEDSSSTASESDAGESDDGSDKTVGDGKDVPPWVKARITREANKRRAAEEASAQAIRERDEALARIPKPPAPSDLPRPMRDQFDDPDAYETALLNWNTKQVQDSTAKEVQENLQREARQRQVEATIADYSAKQAKFAESHPDFDEVFTDTLPITPAMAEALVNAGDDGPAIGYWLGQNPEVCERISKLGAAQAVYEIGKISTKLNAPPPKPKPEPIRPIGARSGSGAKSPDEMTMDEYAAYRKTAH